MTTLVEAYIDGIRSALRDAPSFPGFVESSPVRAMTREEHQVVCVLPGAESVVGGGIGRSTRVREIHLVAHTAGDEHLSLAEAIFSSAHPVLMKFDAAGIVSIEEHGTDEPKYANADLRRQVVTKRYRITYQTDEHSLSK